MSCAKKYGPGAVLINKETTFNLPVELGVLMPVQSASIGALNREKIDNGESRMNRGTSAPFDGAQSEIAWEIQMLMNFSNDTSNGYGMLCWAGGRESDGKLAKQSICGRSLQITRFDRDGLLCEVLNGCLVTNITYSLSANDMCSVTFSGVAASKWELNGIKSGAGLTNISTSATSTTVSNHLRNSYGVMGETISATTPSGIGVKCYDGDGVLVADGEISDITTTSYVIDFTNIYADSTFSIDSIILNYGTKSVESYTVISPADWQCRVYWGDNFEVINPQTVEFVLETGLSFGELTSAKALPSEILSANNTATCSITLYLDDMAETLLQKSWLAVQVYPRGSSPSYQMLNMPQGIITTKPAYELAPDAAASGTIELQGSAEQNNNNVFGWNSTL